MQGFNMGRYVPPEHEGVLSANQVHKKHALGNRGRKAGHGSNVVRFEMPFAIWCTTCPPETIIGQGVRFNAEKKKVGMYYSTPIYSFRMRHPACGGYIEIRTNPKETAYEVTAGATKRDLGDDVAREGQIVLRSEAEKERLRNDAFAALETTIEDRTQATANKTRINDLLDAKDRDWDDPYKANRRLRRSFRVDRKAREAAAANAEELKDRMSLGIDLLPPSVEDSMRADLIEFGDGVDQNEQEPSWSTKPMFENKSSKTSKTSARSASRRPTNPTHAATLGSLVSRNTRANRDPFLQDRAPSSKPLSIGIKRLSKKPEDQTLPESQSPLVQYDSD